MSYTKEQIAAVLDLAVLKPTATAVAPPSAVAAKPAAAPLMNGGANGTAINQNDIDALFD